MGYMQDPTAKLVNMLLTRFKLDGMPENSFDAAVAYRLECFDLGPVQRSILATVRLHAVGVTSSMVSEQHDISIQNASGQLKTLYLKGYIVREEDVQESGGVEHIYHAPVLD